MILDSFLDCRSIAKKFRSRRTNHLEYPIFCPPTGYNPGMRLAVTGDRNWYAPELAQNVVNRLLCGVGLGPILVVSIVDDPYGLERGEPVGQHRSEPVQQFLDTVGGIDNL